MEFENNRFGGDDHCGCKGWGLLSAHDRKRHSAMNTSSPEDTGPIDIAECIEKLRQIRNQCDAARLNMVGIHLTQAIAALETEQLSRKKP